MPWYHLGSHSSSRNRPQRVPTHPGAMTGAPVAPNGGGTRPVGARLRDHLPPRPPRPFSPARALCFALRGVYSSLHCLFGVRLLCFNLHQNPGLVKHYFFPRLTTSAWHTAPPPPVPRPGRPPTPPPSPTGASISRVDTAGTATFSRLVRPTPPAKQQDGQEDHVQPPLLGPHPEEEGEEDGLAQEHHRQHPAQGAQGGPQGRPLVLDQGAHQVQHPGQQGEQPPGGVPAEHQGPGAGRGAWRRSCPSGPARRRP